MNFNSPDEIKKYLNYVVQMEMTVYKSKLLLEKISDVTSDYRNIIEIRKSAIIKPTYETSKVGEKPVRPNMADFRTEVIDYSKYPMTFCISMFLTFFICCWCSDFINRILIFVLSIVFPALITFVQYKFDTEKCQYRNDQNVRDVLHIYNDIEDQYKEKKDEYDKEYSQQMNQYYEEISKLDDEYQNHCNVISVELIELKNLLANAEYYLSTLYSLDVIYEKYRNLIAMCSIYEYFDSGRTSSLVGHEGAYNLFETELRYSMIITNLSDILDVLGEKSNNQYILVKCVNQVEREIAYATYELKRFLRDELSEGEFSDEFIINELVPIEEINEEVAAYVKVLREKSLSIKDSVVSE